MRTEGSGSWTTAQVDRGVADSLIGQGQASACHTKTVNMVPRSKTNGLR